jgi:hypothetical protein
VAGSEPDKRNLFGRPADWLRALAAVLVGNAIYFTAAPWLPQSLRHKAQMLDAGLLLDFLICLALYLIGLRFWPARGSSR